MRPLTIWTAYFLCLAVVLGSLGWFAFRVVDLERSQWQSVAEERETEIVQRAMYGMELAIQAWKIHEAEMPPHDYAAYHMGDAQASVADLRPQQKDFLAPSRVLGADLGFVKFHFQIGPDEKLSSPQIPEGGLLDMALERGDTTQEAVARAQQLQKQFEEGLRNHPLKRILIGIEQVEAAAGSSANLVGELPSLKKSIEDARSIAEARQRQVATNNGPPQSTSNQLRRAAPGSPVVVSGMLRGVWCGDMLLLARHVNINGEPFVQGCWLDRQEIETRLLAGIRSELPRAKLRARSLDAKGSEDRSKALIGLPFELVPGPIPDPYESSSGSTARISLYLALASALVAALAVGVVLRVLLSASDRRAAFVSAVTHELRTPLTTLRMYAEMLVDGKVKPGRQQAYFETLRREADRLAALVENVLAYSRVEARRALPRCEPIALSELVHRSFERAKERADRAGMTLVIDVAAPDARVLADVGAVEQIVFNLVDNACKYASEGDDKTIEVLAQGDSHGAQITIRDHGPGIDPTAAKRLFQPFRRPDQAETSGKPGVGLGLALCRRLARSMGGELRHVVTPGTSGTAFRIELRAAVGTTGE